MQFVAARHSGRRVREDWITDVTEFKYYDANEAVHKMLTDAGMVQNMSRVGHCIDNGPWKASGVF